MENPSPCDANAGLIFGFLDAHGNVAFLFAHKALFELARADDVAFSTDERAGSLKHNRHGGFLDGNRLHLDGVFRIGDNVADRPARYR